MFYSRTTDFVYNIKWLLHNNIFAANSVEDDIIYLSIYLFGPFWFLPDFHYCFTFITCESMCSSFFIALSKKNWLNDAANWDWSIFVFFILTNESTF